MLPAILGPAMANGLLNNGLPQPFSGGLPIPAPGSAPAGGSVISSGGSGLLEMMGILALLSVLLLSGKALRSAREFPRPDSILRLAIERPG